jgi:FMN reductase
MASLVALSGSPSAPSKTTTLVNLVADRLTASGHQVTVVQVRDLPPRPLLHAERSHPEISAVVDQIAAADALVIASPVYKASYTGLLKTLLDLLPQFALAEKSVLPLLTGGSPAHVLALDYALRPVLVSLGAAHVSQGWFVLDKLIDPGGQALAPEAADALWQVVDRFTASLRLPDAPLLTV